MRGRAAAVVAVACAIVVWHSRHLWWGRLDARSYDILFAFIPDHLLLEAGLRDGRIPYWTDAIGAGYPVGGYGYNGYFQPLNLVVALLADPVTGYLVLTALAPLMGVLAMAVALWLFGVRDSRLLLLGVLGFYFSGFFPAHQDYQISQSFACSPLVLALAWRTAQEATARAAMLHGLVGGLAMLSFFAPFQLRFFAAVFVSLVVLVLLEAKGRARRLLALAGGHALTLAIAYPQLKFSWELWRLSMVPAAEPVYFLKGSLPFSVWNFFNRYAVADAAFPGIVNPLVASWTDAAVSPILVFLAVFAVFDAERRLALWLWGVNAAAFVIALGKFNPLYLFLAEAGFALQLRNPSRMLWLFNVTFPVLAVLGARAIPRIAAERRRRLALVYGGLALLAHGLASALHATLAARPELIEAVRGAARPSLRLLATLVHGGSRLELGKAAAWFVTDAPFLLLAAIVAVAFLHRGGGARRAVVPLLALVVWVEGAIFWEPLGASSRHAREVRALFPPLDVSGFRRVASIDDDALAGRNDRLSAYGVFAEANVWYGVESAMVYHTTLSMKRYGDFLHDAVERARRGDLSLLRLVGVDGVVTREPFAAGSPVRDLGSGYRLFRIAERPAIVWCAGPDGFAAIRYDITAYDGRDLRLLAEVPDGGCDLVLGRNAFKAFVLRVDGRALRHELFYSLYRLPALPAGRHEISLEWSWKRLLW